MNCFVKGLCYYGMSCSHYNGPSAEELLMISAAMILYDST